MPTYKLTIAYDGTDFAGWQKQEPPDPALLGAAAPRAQRVAIQKLEPGLEPGKPGRIALRTVQAVVERAVREVVREPIVLLGASRTDSGVHARQQVAVFSCSGDEKDETPETRSRNLGFHAEARRRGEGETHGSESRATGSRVIGGWPESRGVERLLRAVNSRLGEDVLIVGAEVVDAGFNPIRDCIAKGYSYTYWVGKHRPLWERRRAWHTWVDLDIEAMQRAAGYFVGEHDFAAFVAARHGKLTTVREVYECAIREVALEAHTSFVPPSRVLRLEISGNGFLYNMVRIIAGTLHDVGRGRVSADDVPGIIAGLDRVRAGPTLPPEGLCLEWIKYA